MMFSDESAINVHYDTAHAPSGRGRPGGGTHKCDICGKTFTERAKVKRHQATVHGIGDVKTFPCELCPRVFNRRDSLRVHMKGVHKS